MTLPRTASAPFDASDADVIFRTSDDVDFRLYRVILAMASPVFKDMLGLPQPPSTYESLPVVPLSESSSVLEPLLLLCYPSPPPAIDTLIDARLILDAAAKYDMACVLKTMAIHVGSQRFMERNPVGVYCLACRYGWEQVAKSAASCCLKIRSLGRPSLFAEEMKLTTAIAYHRLLVYHAECGRVACAVGRENLPWLEDRSCRPPSGCKSCPETLISSGGSADLISVPIWFSVALDALGGDLLERPDSTTATTSNQFEAQGEHFYRCVDCIKFSSLGKFSVVKEVLAQKVREEIGKVELEFEK